MSMSATKKVTYVAFLVGFKAGHYVIEAVLLVYLLQFFSQYEVFWNHFIFFSIAVY